MQAAPPATIIFSGQPTAWHTTWSMDRFEHPSLSTRRTGLWACGQCFFSVVHMSTARLPIGFPDASPSVLQGTRIKTTKGGVCIEELQNESRRRQHAISCDSSADA